MQMGAVAPSGVQLGRLMVEVAGVAPQHVLAELGAGTGSITEQIQKAYPRNPLIAFEPSIKMASFLRTRFPGLHITERLAHEMPEALAEWGHARVDRVLSGLPLTIWPREVQDIILTKVRSCMTDDGRFVTFTYMHSQLLPGAGVLKELLERHFCTVSKTRIAWKNLPPAFAYCADCPRH